jgi:branched-chain amino acid transport system ATP-binding protein
MGESGGALRVTGLEVRYGAAQAVFGVDLTVASGQMLAVLGANGAGKTSLARAISGLVPASAGTVELNGKDVTRWRADRRRKAGLVYIPEGRGIFPGLSVGENLRMAVRPAGRRAERAEAMERAALLFPILGQRAGQRAGSLSGGEQQMLALARALAVQPKVLIADELSLGLAPLVVDAVFEGVQAASRDGVSVVLIEQFVHRALALADSALIMNRGQVAWTGPAADAGAEVLERYLGSSEETEAADEGAEGTPR